MNEEQGERISAIAADFHLAFAETGSILGTEAAVQLLLTVSEACLSRIDPYFRQQFLMRLLRKVTDMNDEIFEDTLDYGTFAGWTNE
jgi:hypothetical protein